MEDKIFKENVLNALNELIKRQDNLDTGIGQLREETKGEFKQIREETDVGFQQIGNRFALLDKKIEILDKKIEILDRKIDNKFEVLDQKTDKILEYVEFLDSDMQKYKKAKLV